MGEGIYDDEPFEGELLPAQDRLWRHPAERGAEQAAANLQARRLHGRHWPSLIMSFIAGCSVVGLAWLMQDSEPAEIVVSEVVELSAPVQSLPEGPLSFDEWANDVAETNRHSVVGLHLGGNAQHDMAQAILFGTDGHLMTSAHALIGAEDITVSLPGADTTPAQVIAADAVSGVAVLKINATDLPPPVYADDGQVRVSDRLVALAHHGEDTDSLARTVDVLGDDQVTAAPNGDMLSGLFRLSNDLNGDWAGSAVLEESGGIVAMAIEGEDGRHYGVPIDHARKWAQELIDTGSVEHRAWLGVEFVSGLTDRVMEERDLLGGVLIQRVWNQTPAAQGGLVAGDVIVGAGPVNVLDRQDLIEYLATVSPGDVVEFRFSRVSGSGVGPESSNPQPDDMTSEILSTTVIVGTRAA